MYGIYMLTLCNIYHQYTPNVSIYTIHGSYGIGKPSNLQGGWLLKSHMEFIKCHLSGTYPTEHKPHLGRQKFSGLSQYVYIFVYDQKANGTYIHHQPSGLTMVNIG